MQQVAQKPRQKFCGKKTAKKRKTHPIQPEKGKTGCVLGAGENGSGWERIKPDGKTRSSNQCEPHSHATHEKRNPAKTQCFRRFCGRGRRTWSRLPARVLLPGGERPAPTEAGAETGAVACVPPARTRPTTRTAGGPAAAPRCQILPHANEKSQVPQKRYLTFLAGAEGLEPSARGFGVDVETR